MLIVDVLFHACDSMKQIVKKIPFHVCVWLLLEDVWHGGHNTHFMLWIAWNQPF